MANPFDEPDGPQPGGTPAKLALLAQLRAELAQRQVAKAALYRVVEVTRDVKGRLVQQGRIWHTDLDHARRFGRALASNSVSQKVVVADNTGAVLEQLLVVPLGRAAPSGWAGWRDMPLPPVPHKPPPARVSRPPPQRTWPDEAMLPVLVAPASAFGLLDDDPVARPLAATVLLERAAVMAEAGPPEVGPAEMGGASAPPEQPPNTAQETAAPPPVPAGGARLRARLAAQAAPVAVRSEGD